MSMFTSKSNLNMSMIHTFNSGAANVADLVNLDRSVKYLTRSHFCVCVRSYYPDVLHVIMKRRTASE